MLKLFIVIGIVLNFSFSGVSRAEARDESGIWNEFHFKGFNEITFLVDSGNYFDVDNEERASLLRNIHVRNEEYKKIAAFLGAEGNESERPSTDQSNFYRMSGKENIDRDSMIAVPLPPAVWLLGSALIGLVIVARRVRH